MTLAMSWDEWARHDGVALAERVKKGELTPQELARQAAEGVAKVNPALSGVIELFEDALADPAKAGADLSGPFAGLPFLMKDLGPTMAGRLQEMGSLLMRGNRATADTFLTGKMRRAGLNLIGRTTTPEFGVCSSADNPAVYVTRNPWNTDYTTCGSSAGSGAMVAAGVVPMAHSTDGGGSIRIPAALCGLFGLKPSRGRVSLAPIGETLAGAGAQLAVSLSVRDSAALLDALAGNEPGDPYTAPPAGSFLAATERPPGKLRVAFMRRPVGGEALDPVLVAAVEGTAKLLEELGHHVEEAYPDYDAVAAGAAFGTVMAANTWTNIQIRANGRTPGPDDLEPVTRQAAEQGRAVVAEDYIRAVQTFHRTGRQLGAFFERHDVLLSPTIARVSLPLGAVRMDGSAEQYQVGLAPMVAFTSVCNVAGVPAMSVPLAWTDDGLPIGLHFAGRFGSEEMLFSLAAELERARPWRDRRPSEGGIP